MGSLDLKLVLLGHKNVGKTCVFNRYVYDQFGRTTMTIGAYFGMKECVVGDQLVNLAIWDTAGEEKFDSLTNFYCRSAKAALLCYDITVRETFLRLNRWVQKIEDEAGDDCVKVFVGTKLDIVQGDPSLRKVSEDEAKAYAESKGCVVIETSARTGENIDAAYMQAVSEVLKSLGDMSGGKKDKLDLRGDEKPKSDGCC